MFFWRAINTEVWMRIYFDDDATALDDRSYRAGFVERGDRAVARSDPDAAALLATAKPNPGNHLFLQTGDDIYARVPLKSRLITPADDVVDAILEAIDHADGVDVDDGDLVLVSEKAFSISQGNALPVADIRTTRCGSSAVALREPHRQWAWDSAIPPRCSSRSTRSACPRILLAAVAGAVTRPVRHARRLLPRRRRSGERDRRTVVGQPPALRHVGVQGADRLRRRGAPDLERDRGPHRATRSTSRSSTPTTSPPRCSPPRAGVDAETVLALVVDNPLGQSAEQTPFGLVRTLV